MKTKTVPNNELLKYASVKEAALTTTQIIKDSFKNAFKKQDENGYVIIKNNRREEESVLVSMHDYTNLIKKIEKLEEKLFDEAASKINPDDYEYTNIKDLDF